MDKIFPPRGDKITPPLESPRGDKDRQARFDQLLFHALELADDDQEGYLESACDEPALRQEVLAALRRTDQRDHFLDRPVPLDFAAFTAVARPAGSAAASGVHETAAERGDAAVSARVGDRPRPMARIGPYEILEEIGSGGMGRVFLAEQHEPIYRRVAVKLMKNSLASAEAMARFSAERQAMARLGHANVATILDGGTTEDGHPFFVMEYVPGIPITEYCDDKALSLDDRLRLFLEVCAGVQHAHLNQILHRDLKPTNILVCEVDGRPMVKIIDFGIAKALDGPLTKETLQTGNRVLGTPAYMSPEALVQAGVDARTDVYSIGMVLYELLVGAGPFKEGSGLAQILHQICEEDPPRLSRKVSSLSADTLSSVAGARRVEPLELPRRLADDLDWIVQKAIAKEPGERYDSAAELAAEIERHLSHEPVLAGPHTLGYRLGKLVRRNRLASAAVAVAFFALVAGIIGTSLGLVRARQAEEKARCEAAAAGQVADFLVELFESSDPELEPSREMTTRELLERGTERIRRELGEQPMVRARMMATLGKVHMKLGLHEHAAPLLEESLELRRQELGHDDRDVAASLIDLGLAYHEEGRFDEAERMIREGLNLEEKRLGPDSPELVDVLRHLAAVYTQRGEFGRGEALLMRALEIGEAAYGPDHSTMGRVAASLGSSYAYQGRFPLAERFYRRALEIHEVTLGSRHPRVAGTLNSLASLASYNDRDAEAEELYRRSLGIYEEVLGPEHPRVRMTLSNLGYFLFRTAQYEKALTPLEQAVALDRAHQAPETAHLASRLTNLGLVYWKLGRLGEAEALLRRAIEIRDRLLIPAHPHRATSIWGLANVYRDQGRYAVAEPLYRLALEIRERALPPGNRELLVAFEEYVVLLRRMGREEEASRFEAMATASTAAQG